MLASVSTADLWRLRSRRRPSVLHLDAAKSGETVTVRLEGKWRRDADGCLMIDPSQTTITSIGEGSNPITGAEFVDAIHEAIPDAFSDLDDVLGETAH